MGQLLPFIGAALPTHAALVAYDGFGNYGNSPANYALPPAGNAIYHAGSTTGQNPVTTGFTGEWNSPDNYASTVYIQAEPTQLVYNDGAGNLLDSTAGQMTLSRVPGSNSAGVKTWSRNLSLGTSLPNVMYVSMVVQATAGIPFQWRSASSNNGNDDRRFGFNVDAAGSLDLVGVQAVGGTLTAPGVATLTPDQTHFIVMRFENNVNPSAGGGSEGDQMQFWVDPVLTSEGAPDHVFSTTANRMNWYVAGNASWTLEYFEFAADPDGGQGVTFDELRIGDTWDDVTPSSLIPEPSSALLGLLGLGLVALRRRR